MKKLIKLLTTVLTEKRETTVGYRIFNLIIITLLTASILSLFTSYGKYYFESENYKETLKTKAELYDFLTEEKYKTMDNIRTIQEYMDTTSTR